MLFLFIDQHNYNQPPISLREPTCRKSTLPLRTLEIAEAFLFSGKGGERMGVKGVLIGTCGNKTHIRYKGEEIYLDTYLFKGCWGCGLFSKSADFPYLFVEDVAKEKRVTIPTVRRWIKRGKLKAELFERVEIKFQSPRKYHILKEEVS